MAIGSINKNYLSAIQSIMYSNLQILTNGLTAKLFQFFSILSSKLPQWNIFTCTYLYFFGDILHILWSKNKEVGYYASFREFTEKEHNYQLSYFVTKNMQDVTK